MMKAQWISKYLSEKDMAEISTAVAAAEMQTTGDIVPVVVRRSSAVRHVPVILGLTFAMLFIGLEVLGLNGWYLSHSLPVFSAHWGVQFAFLLLLIVLAWALAHLHPVQRLLTSNADEIDQVERRAQLEFFLNRVNQTSRNTAVLIFVSVMERRAVILADEGIAKKLPSETWVEILKPLSQSLQKGEWSRGFQEAIRQTGTLLKTHFPADSGKIANELSNQIIVKE